MARFDRGAALFVVWWLVQVSLVGYGAATGRWAWRMFGDPASHRRHFVLEAREPDGEWERLPLDELFRFHRGFTDLTVMDDAFALYGRGGRRERRDFVRWAVRTLAPDRPYTEARLWADQVAIRTGRRSVDDLGTFPLASP